MSEQDTHASAATSMENELVSQVDAPYLTADQHEERVDQSTKESSHHSSRRRSSPSSHHRNYRKRSPSESPERRSPENSPSSHRRSRNSDYRDDRRHRRRSRTRSRSRSPRRRRRSLSPRNLIHTMDLGPEVNGRLTTLLWKVEKLLENQERVLKNQEMLLKLVERQQGMSTAAATVSGERRLVNGVRGKDHERSGTAELRIPSNLLESVAHLTSETVSNARIEAVPCNTQNHKVTKTALKKLAGSSTNATGIDDPTVSVHESVDLQSIAPVPSKYNVFVSPTITNLNAGCINCDSSSSTTEDQNESTSDIDRTKELLTWAERIQKSSCSIGNFSVNLVKVLFTKEEMLNRNCSGTRGKGALDSGKLDLIKFCAFKLYSIPEVEQDSVWKQKCVISIDEFLRRGNRSRVQNKSIKGSVMGPLDPSIIVELTSQDVKENKNDIEELS